MTPHHHLRLRAKDGLFELQSQIFAQIRSALHPAAAAATAASEDVAKPEELAKDLAEILERRGIEAPAGAGCAPHARVAIAVIERPLLGVGENGVGLGDFLKALFRIRIIGIPVRMVLHGELAISALQLLSVTVRLTPALRNNRVLRSWPE